MFSHRYAEETIQMSNHMTHKLPCSPTILEVQTLAKFIHLGSTMAWKMNAPHRAIDKSLAPRVLVSDRGVDP